MFRAFCPWRIQMNAQPGSSLGNFALHKTARSHRRFALFLTALIVCAITTAVFLYVRTQAASLFVEEFSYSTGQLTTVSGGTWVNFSGTGNFIQVTGGSLTYSGYVSSGIGNKIDIVSVGSSAEDVYRQFTTQTSGTTYAAFLVNVANTTGLSLNTSANGDHFAGFLASSSTTNFASRVSIRLGTVA